MLCTLGARVRLAAATVLLVALQTSVTPAQQEPVRLLPTAHPPVPADVDGMWYAPSNSQGKLSRPLSDFVRGAKLLDEDHNAAAALPLLSEGALARTPLADYARFYTGRALLQLGRFDAAEAAFAAVALKKTDGHLPEDAALGQAQAREGRTDFAGAVAIYASLLEASPSAPQPIWARLGAAAERAGDVPRAIAAARRVYYDYPLSSQSESAGATLARLQAFDDPAVLNTRELTRADALFTARRWTGARASYARAAPHMAAADRDRIVMRLAACDAQLGRHKEASTALRPLLDGPVADEATFYYLDSLRALGAGEEYVRRAEQFAAANRTSPFAEDVLNNLATHLIVVDDDARADVVFADMIVRYPGGRFTERAYWRSGWWAYRDQRYADASRLFDRGAAQFPRSDYRPSWLYWSGRSAEAAGDIATATARYRLTAADYFNSYYGRAALAMLRTPQAVAIPPNVTRTPVAIDAPAFPTASRVATLIETGLYQEALNELQYAQRVWGDSPSLTATVALVHNRMGNLRAGINAMKRAYPQWMAAGGETLPPDILKVVFPLNYWPLIQKHALLHGLDPYLVAALMAQESTFDPVVRSSADAVGLMQVLPSTGRQYARKLRIAPFSAGRLTDPETNVRIGTTIFADGIRKFGGAYFALAAYNAGESRVAGWQRERPGMPQDEFIDDIPFPETQNYVKRILGTAEDYRRIYGKPTQMRR